MDVHTHHQIGIVRRQDGVTYLLVMMAVVIMGLALTGVGKHWSMAAKREKEAELLFRGNRIKTAIEAYALSYEARKASRPNRYPLTLEDLTKPPKPFLQKLYTDPISDQDFDLIRVGGEIRGVRSRGKGAPLNQVAFRGASSYRQIVFESRLEQQNGCQPIVNPINPLLTIPCTPAGTVAAVSGGIAANSQN